MSEDDRDEEESEFRRALSDAKPIKKGATTAPPAPPQVSPPNRSEEETVRFEVHRDDERVWGKAPGVDSKLVKRLRSGQQEVELEIDLHGFEEREARSEVLAALAQAWEEGLRCVLVIHGRGLHSSQGPRLKEALLNWIAEPPHAARLLAFATAAPGHGQTGATYLLLRRRR